MLTDQIICFWFTKELFNEKIVNKHIAITLDFPYHIK